MPLRYIEIPPAITFVDPLTGAPATVPDGTSQVWDFKLILNKLLSNPKWVESYEKMRAQAAIEGAFRDARDGVMALAEDDWLLLKEAVENPRIQFFTPNGAQVMVGFGVHPAASSQLLPLLDPIMNATTTTKK